MRHLTEDILIQYQFALLSDSKRQQAAAHLGDCADCRQALAALREKFGVLDVLGAEEAVTDELIAKTVSGVRQTPGAGRKPALLWWARPTLLAAAAVLIVGVLWLQRPVQKSQEAPALVAMETGKAEMDAARQYAMKEQTQGEPGALPPVQGPRLRGDDRAVAEQPAAVMMETDTVLGARGPRLRGDDGAVAERSSDRLSRRLRSGLLPEDEDDGGVRFVKAEEIADEAPFAPASAIELVVLPNPEAMQVTIYNAADLTLVRDTRKLVLKPGWNWLQFMWAGTKIDPTSLSLRPLEYADKVSIEQLVYPAGLTEIGRWLVRSEVEGAVEFEITYFTSGLSWRAVYEGTLSADERTMDMKGYVRVNNQSGQDYVNTQTRLLLGQVRLLDEIRRLAKRRDPYGPDMPDEEKGIALGTFMDAGLDLKGGTSLLYETKTVEKQGLSEYTLYMIEGTEDLQDGWGKRLESLDARGIPVKSVYKYDEDRYGKRTVRFVSFVNDTEHELGESPLPEGRIHLYRDVDDADGLSFVGMSAFKYIPVNEDVELNLDSSALVTVEPKLMDVKTEAYLFDPNNDVVGWDEIETWRVEVTNTRDVSAEVEVTRNFGTAWDIEMGNPKSEIRNSKQIRNTNDRMAETVEAGNNTRSPAAPVPSFAKATEGRLPPWQGESLRDASADPVFERLDKERGRFTVMVEARSKAAFTFTVTKHLGQRAEESAD